MAAKTCHVFMKKDLEKVGMAGQLIKVAKSFAENYLLPNKYGVLVHDHELESFTKKNVVTAQKKEVLATKTSMLAEKIKETPIVIREKVHDSNKLYGSIKEDQIVDALREKGILINRKQVEFVKSIKAVGDYKVTIRLSTSLKPEVDVKIVALQ